MPVSAFVVGCNLLMREHFTELRNGASAPAGLSGDSREQS